ncbi:fatty acid-binding protein, heart-like [Patiria miniata]|uniref:Uncharacterized protein n=1 Tax=Patiria miniata TaxID=46514 RepID=A0A914A7H0_PATMI|nr:fatty acid-binding protein, heart-like [Patiria miniata]
MAISQTPVLEISQDGDVFKIITKGLKTFDTNFTVGQEYTDVNPLNDEPSTYLPMWDGDKLRTENSKSHPEAICVVRELVDGQLVQTKTHGTGDKAVVCKRIYDKK